MILISFKILIFSIYFQPQIIVVNKEAVTLVIPKSTVYNKLIRQSYLNKLEFDIYRLISEKSIIVVKSYFDYYKDLPKEYGRNRLEVKA